MILGVARSSFVSDDWMHTQFHSWKYPRRETARCCHMDRRRAFSVGSPRFGILTARLKRSRPPPGHLGKVFGEPMASLRRLAGDAPLARQPMCIAAASCLDLCVKFSIACAGSSGSSKEPRLFQGTQCSAGLLASQMCCSQPTRKTAAGAWRTATSTRGFACSRRPGCRTANGKRVDCMGS